MPFQSRNRESFIFYFPTGFGSQQPRRRFNLVIENLLFSTSQRPARAASVISFNLVIENLLFSTMKSLDTGKGITLSFNLVIENLLFSTALKAFLVLLVDLPFQSRNRESFIFYLHLRDCFLILLMRFNLVIENLLFSTYLSCTHPLP